MKFFLDTANLDELRSGASWGIVDGVTTNPSLIAREGQPIADQIRRICEIVDGDVSAEFCIVSPFVGRLDGVSWVGMDLVREILRIYGHYGFRPQVLAASLRSPIHNCGSRAGGRPHWDHAFQGAGHAV